MNLDFVLTAASLAAMIGTVISILTSLVPRLNVWFAGLAPETKRAVMLLLGLGISIIIVGLSCFTTLVIVACTRTEWYWTAIQVLGVWIGYAGGNQAAFLIFPKPEKVVVAALQANAERMDRLVAKDLI